MAVIALRAQIGIVMILGDIALELVAEAILLLHDGHLRCLPKRPPQAGIAKLGEPRHATVEAGLLGREIKTTELQKLTVVTETPEVARFGKHRESDDGTDAWNGAERLISRRCPSAVH